MRLSREAAEMSELFGRKVAMGRGWRYVLPRHTIVRGEVYRKAADKARGAERGRLLRLAGDAAGARAAFDAVLKKRPDEARALAWRWELDPLGPGAGDLDRAIELDRQNREERSDWADIEGALKSLSDRERDVMDLLLLGNSNKEVARHLSLSPKTIERHRANIMRKLDVNSFAELVSNVAVLRALSP